MTGWVIRRPPAIDEEIARWTVGAAPELSSLRAALQQAVRAQAGAGTDVRDLEERLTIVATELAGNALRHGRPPTVVILQRSDGSLVIDVADHDPASAPAAGDRRRSGDGGLGLILAERLAEDVGWYPTGAGKSIWAIFDLAPH